MYGVWSNGVLKAVCINLAMAKREEIKLRRQGLKVVVLAPNGTVK